MWQRLLVMRQSVTMIRLRLIGRLLDDTVGPASTLQSAAPTGLTFDPLAHLSTDPRVDLSVGLVLVGGAYRVPQVPVPQTFQGEGLVEAPGGLLQLCILVGGQLWGSGGQQMRVGIWLDGRKRRIVGISLALLYWEEGAAGFGAGHFDSPLVARVTPAGGWGSQGRLGGVTVVEQLVV